MHLTDWRTTIRAWLQMALDVIDLAFVEPGRTQQELTLVIARVGAIVCPSARMNGKRWEA